MPQSLEGPQLHDSPESITWAGDFTNVPPAAGALSNPTATLYYWVNNERGAAFPAGLSGGASISGQQVLQAVTGLTNGTDYVLLFMATKGGNVVDVFQVLQCRF